MSCVERAPRPPIKPARMIKDEIWLGRSVVTFAFDSNPPLDPDTHANVTHSKSVTYYHQRRLDAPTREGNAVKIRHMRKSGIAGLAILTFFARSKVMGQSPTAAALTFEVASVKVAISGYNGFRGGCHGIDSSARTGPDQAPPLGRCVITDARLSHLISIAFGVPMQELSTGPDWIQRGDLRFDVNARAEDPAKTTQKQLLTMLQNLLVDRFHLKFHYQTSEAAGFSLAVAKSGPKLRKSTSDEVKTLFTGPHGEAVLKPAPGQAISLTARKYSMEMLVSLLAAIGMSGPGLDKTGLSGEYDLTLSWDSEAGPALSTALHQQLGLQMKSEKVPVSTFVVDAAEKPSSN
jgi:uncharacterized protein (TIGR03435 family)